MHRSGLVASNVSALRAARSGSAPQRVDGACKLTFRPVGRDGTALGELYQRAPCRVLFPQCEPGEPPQAVMLTTSGGLTAGDRTDVRIQVASGAQATIATQAAERIYRASEADAEVNADINLLIGERAWGEWLAQETILYDGARLRRSLRADVACSGRLLALESVVFGRTAMREGFDTGFLHDAWQIRRDGVPVWADALHLDGDVRGLRAAPFGFGTNTACGTLLYVGEDAVRHLESVRGRLDGCPVSGAATVLDGVLIARVIAERADELRIVLAALAAHVRHAAGGWAAGMPRVWNC